MELSALAGNARIKEQLSHRGELSHAYILSGPAGSGKHTLARLLTAAMVCDAPAGGRPCGACVPCKKIFSGIHPDFSAVSGTGEGKAITVDQIRTVRADAYIRPNEGRRKIYLLENAGEMNFYAQNAMLKLLEEGPRYAAFLLLTENAGNLLQTVRSRCEELALAPVPLRECEKWLTARFPQKGAEELRQAALDCQGILGRAVETLSGGNEKSAARRTLVKNLAGALERGSELDLFEAAMDLGGKEGRTDLNRTLEELEQELAGRLAASRDRRRLFRAVELVRKLRAASRFNANSAQLAGWLCAGMFVEE